MKKVYYVGPRKIGKSGYKSCQLSWGIEGCIGINFLGKTMWSLYNFEYIDMWKR